MHMKRTKLICKQQIQYFGFLLMVLMALSCQKKDAPPFVFGADISFVPQEEAGGRIYSDHGVEKDVLEILKDHEFNWIRLRLFVDPDAENGYSRGGQGFCGLERTI